MRVLLDTRDSESAYELIEQLATESDRHTARKERNHQRSCFKDVLNTLDVRKCVCVTCDVCVCGGVGGGCVCACTHYYNNSQSDISLYRIVVFHKCTNKCWSFLVLHTKL